MLQILASPAVIACGIWNHKGGFDEDSSKFISNPESSSMGVKKLGKSINYNYFQNPESFFEKFPYFANFLT